MPKGEHLSPHQRGIVKRYYEHRDTIMLNKLAEIISDLYLADTPARKKRLWDSARKAMANLGVEPDRIDQIAREQDLKTLAEFVGGLQRPER
jgi:hypothetical protein